MLRALGKWLLDWLDRRADRKRLKHMQWLDDHPIIWWKVYRRCPYDALPVLSCRLTARTRAEVHAKVAAIPLELWSVDEIPWSAEWGGMVIIPHPEAD